MNHALTENRTLTELEQFHRFIGEALQNGGRQLSPEESLHEFREYQREIERCRRELEPAYERSLAEEGRIFDPEELKERVKARLAEKGIVE